MPNIILGLLSMLDTEIDRGAGEIRLSDLTPEQLAALNGPFDAIVINHMPRDVSFPDVGNLFLRHCGDADGRQAMMRFSGISDLNRLAVDVSEIAYLNGYVKAMTVVVDVAAKTGGESGTAKSVPPDAPKAAPDVTTDADESADSDPDGDDDDDAEDAPKAEDEPPAPNEGESTTADNPVNTGKRGGRKGG